MTLDFDKNKPIYQQLIDRLSGDIIRGTRKPGDKLPSVREYAVEAGVNANTIQRVYKEMESMGITETKRGQGSFVTEDQKRLEKLREDMKSTLVQSFITSLEAYGFSREEISELVRRELS
ncbi:GntR family transcriptional regulator [Planococcus salinus]|uniref:GntR family transcriptional regulator n=1 Tax=Planococcus salinus TaxID=1848460 RepID=A0A3M8P7F4_9BACL|nr:GntR family transcriptional regulator [Planococcus salinus]RNF39210.1 GntR family transcriptional regulator [Planococcus salinus]